MTPELHEILSGWIIFGLGFCTSLFFCSIYIEKLKKRIKSIKPCECGFEIEKCSTD